MSGAAGRCLRPASLGGCGSVAVRWPAARCGGWSVGRSARCAFAGSAGWLVLGGTCPGGGGGRPACLAVPGFSLGILQLVSQEPAIGSGTVS